MSKAQAKGGAVKDGQTTGGGAGAAPPKPPFSRSFSVDELLRRPEEALTITAEPDELLALAREDGVASIEALKAVLKINKQGKEVRVTGEVRASVTQECVVTLEPFTSEIVEDVDVRFAFPVGPPPSQPRDGARLSRRRAQDLLEHRPAPAPVIATHEEDDPPDTIIDGKIDLGALAAEFMALGLDPYPRKPGVAFAETGDEEAADESPFAQLAGLKKEN
ncbi:MAG: DUF177 domain-containing protein [Beijerinckiaceae bacterium]|nr:DUF177 domain-containing protein [Beijerinckiaceae bacterium]